MMVNAFRKPQRVNVIQWDGSKDGFKEIQGFFGDKVQLMDLYNNKVMSMSYCITINRLN